MIVLEILILIVISDELKNIFKINEFYDVLINTNIILQYIKFAFFFIQWKVIYFKKHELN